MPKTQNDHHSVDPLVTFETQHEVDLFSGEQSERRFLKLYVEARRSGLLAAISDRDWKTLCAVATYMDKDGSCFPSQDELARALGCSRQTANERVQSLAKFRFQGKPVFLIQPRERTANGTWARNAYRVLPISSLRIFDKTKPPTAHEPDHQAIGPLGSAMSASADMVPTRSVSEFTLSANADTKKNAGNKKEEMIFRKAPTKFLGKSDDATEPRSHLQQPAQTVSHGIRNTADDSDGEGETPQDRTTAAIESVDASDTPHWTNSAPPARTRLLGNPAAEFAPSESGGDGLQRLRDQAEKIRADIARNRERQEARERDLSEGVTLRRGRPPGTREERDIVTAYLEDFRGFLGDEAPLSSSVSRAINIFRSADVPRSRWVDLLYEANAITKDKTQNITKKPGGSATGFAAKNRAPYFFAILEDLCGSRDQSVATISGTA